MLRAKSLHQLRAIAQGYGVPDIFAKDMNQLIQAIELKQIDMVPDVAPPIPRPEYDARLMSKPPSKSSNQSDILALLEPHIQRGLHITFPELERWHMRHGKKEDTGTTRMPLRVVMDCADRIMR